MAVKKKLAAKPRSTARAGERGSVVRAGTAAGGKATPKGKLTAKAASAATPARREKGSRSDVARVDAGPGRAVAPSAKKVAAKAAAPKAAPRKAAASKTASKVMTMAATPKPKRPASALKKPAPDVKSPVVSQTLGAGDRAPSFELPDQSGAAISSAKLAGKPYVLYFYPKDDTPGCTTQACGFRDASAEFEGAGARVIGVSPDSVASHQKFVSKYGLPFTLLSDTGHELAAAYGVWSLKKNYGREYMGIVRSTFLIDGEGVVRNVWRGVRVNGHVAEVRAAATELA